jgi:SNF2 family DNA or RNA helicase
MTTLRAFAELSENGARIEVHFRYSPEAVEAINQVPGRKFHGNGRPKYWSIPADLTSARRLREEFGTGLQLGDAVRAWGREATRAERQIASIASADDATLRNLDDEQAGWLRPYQRADVAMMAATNVLNANQPGTGKTVEVIYAVQEAGLRGPHLIVAPITLHKDPWRNELRAHALGARILFGETPAERRNAINAVAREQAAGTADDLWMIVNPDLIRVQKFDADTAVPAGRRVLSRDHKGNAYCPKDDGSSEALFGIEWGAVVLDEFHKYGLGEDRNTMFARATAALRQSSARAYALSGTPMGGKPVRLWGVLNFIEPQLYPGKWKWAQQWLLNAEGTGPVDPGAGTGIGDIQPGRESEFYQAHSKHMIRRTRKDALPGLPDKIVIDVPVEMTPKQAKVYNRFARAAEVELDGGRVSADGILAEFARLKQMANALCEIRDGEVAPTYESGKLPILLDRLDTYGIRAKDAEPGARAIVASESQRFVVVLEGYLAEQGLAVRRLDGSVTGRKRDAVIDWYKEDVPDARVLVMTTQTGGVGLNLGMTGSIHVMDETWNPDDQEQLEDRGMRDRTTALNVLYYRTADTIQEYIAEIGLMKQAQNKKVLADEVRRMMKERG